MSLYLSFCPRAEDAKFRAESCSPPLIPPVLLLSLWWLFVGSQSNATARTGPDGVRGGVVGGLRVVRCR